MPWTVSQSHLVSSRFASSPLQLKAPVWFWCLSRLRRLLISCSATRECHVYAHVLQLICQLTTYAISWLPHSEVVMLINHSVAVTSSTTIDCESKSRRPEPLECHSEMKMVLRRRFPGVKSSFSIVGWISIQRRRFSFFSHNSWTIPWNYHHNNKRRWFSSCQEVILVHQLPVSSSVSCQIILPHLITTNIHRNYRQRVRSP